VLPADEPEEHMNDPVAGGSPVLDFAMDLPIRTDWSNVEIMRNAILGCFRAAFAHLDSCERMAMVAGELMENAIKYGRWSDHDRQLRLRLRGDERHVEIVVECPVEPDSERLAELFAILTWIKGFATPAEAYQARMLAIAESPAQTGSKLGLVRIAYEGHCSLVAEVKGHTLRVKGGMAMTA
jgi:anti-sigma regulatory factor (Ser/Thr protein kinase)